MSQIIIISYILPTKAKAINGRLGINLLFGKEDDHPTVKAKKKKKFELKGIGIQKRKK